MPSIHFKQPDGHVHTLAAECGHSIMAIATAAGLPGLLGSCGGSLACATCHVYVEAGWQDRVPPAQDEEQQLLECVSAERRAGSRLSCQLVMHDALDGLSLELPDAQ